MAIQFDDGDVEGVDPAHGVNPEFDVREEKRTVEEQGQQDEGASSQLPKKYNGFELQMSANNVTGYKYVHCNPVDAHGKKRDSPYRYVAFISQMRHPCCASHSCKLSLSPELKTLLLPLRWEYQRGGKKIRGLEYHTTPWEAAAALACHLNC